MGKVETPTYKIFERIINYILVRVAMTLDIMFVVVLATVFFDFSPLTYSRHHIK